MRASFCAAGLGIALFVVGWFAFSVATPAPADVKKDAKSDDRDLLADKLLERVSINELNNVLLKEALGLLTETHEITILVDGASFGGDPAAVAVNAQENPVLNATINVPAMKNVRLATILKHITDQIEGVYLIYPDHIKIVSAARAFSITKPNLSTFAPGEMEQPLETQNAIIRSIPLVTVNFGERPLVDALRDIESRTNTTIILANQAADKAKTPILARLTNVPVDTAVATLAEMAGLKLARRGNVLLVTIAERAKEFDPPPPPQPMGALGGLQVVPQGDSAAELKAQLAELEKELAERKIAELEKKLADLKKDQ